MSTYSQPIQPDVQNNDLKKQYQQAELLRERIDEELDTLSKSAINEDTVNLRSTLNSNLTAMSFLCSEMREILEQKPADIQSRWKLFFFFVC